MPSTMIAVDNCVLTPIVGHRHRRLGAATKTLNANETTKTFGQRSARDSAQATEHRVAAATTAIGRDGLDDLLARRDGKPT